MALYKPEKSHKGWGIEPRGQMRKRWGKTQTEEIPRNRGEEQGENQRIEERKRTKTEKELEDITQGRRRTSKKKSENQVGSEHREKEKRRPVRRKHT
jgi:hypothetical protein